MHTLQEANSNPYTYEIVKGSDEYSFTITNNYVPAVVNVPITTVWDDDDNRDGIRAKETAITLHGSNGKVYQRIVTGKDDFATVFEDVPKFFDEGREVVYTVTQNEMNGYAGSFLFSFFDSKCEKKFFNFIVAEHIENIKTIYST